MGKYLYLGIFGFISLFILDACNSILMEGGYNSYTSTGLVASRSLKTIIDRDEAAYALQYLNKVRSNPGFFSNEIGVDLSDIQPKQALIVNPILMKVAEEKAADMATRDYFGHVTPEGYGINIMINDAGYKLPASWLSNKKLNYFESIAARYAGRTQTGGIDLIRQLILEPDVPDLGHRKHLLGMDDWNSDLTDVGIGFARNPNSYYKNYICVIIAKKGNNQVHYYKTVQR